MSLVMSAATPADTNAGSAWYSAWNRSGGLPALSAVSSLVTRASPCEALLTVTWMSGCEAFQTATILSTLDSQLQNCRCTTLPPVAAVVVAAALLEAGALLEPVLLEPAAPVEDAAAADDAPDEPVAPPEVLPADVVEPEPDEQPASSRPAATATMACRRGERRAKRMEILRAGRESGCVRDWERSQPEPGTRQCQDQRRSRFGHDALVMHTSPDHQQFPAARDSA